MRLLMVAVLGAQLIGCNNLFFQPDDIVYFDIAKSGISYREEFLKSTDGVIVHTVWLRSEVEPARGVVVQFHGNAQNLTAHGGYAAWLIHEGFNVVLFDYRGYGSSTGGVSRSGAIEDGITVLTWVKSEKALRDLPLVILGQSLGGALALASLHEAKIHPQLTILDSTFSSYRAVASELLRRQWLTWPFQWLPRLVISDSQSPESNITTLPGPYLFIHSTSDPVVPLVNSDSLYGLASEPKTRWLLAEPGHIEALAPDSPYRARLLDFLAETLSWQKP